MWMNLESVIQSEVSQKDLNFFFLNWSIVALECCVSVCCCCCVASVMSDSVRPHRRQPTRLPCPWDCPGKNTGVGCHFLLQCMKVKRENEVAQSCPTLSDPMDCSLPGSSIHGIFQSRVLEWGAIAFSDISGYQESNTDSVIHSELFTESDYQVEVTCPPEMNLFK